VFVIAEACEVGATQVEVRQNIVGSSCIVSVIAEACEVGATQVEVRQNIGVQLA
jgi:hypothetical protein